MELSAVLQCVRKLLSPPREGDSILFSLKDTLDRFRSYVQERELTNELQSSTADLNIPQYETSRDDVSVYCRFTEQGLALLCLLDRALRQALAQDQTSTRDLSSGDSSSNHRDQQPPPGAMLSPGEEKSVHTLLQFLVALGLFPFLLPGAGHLLRAQLGEMAPKISKSSTKLHTKSRFLYHHCRHLLRLFNTPVIGPSVLSCHLSTVLAALLQISHSSAQPSQEKEEMDGESENLHCSGEDAEKCPVLSLKEVKECQEELAGLLESLPQPLVVKELLRLQGMRSGGGGGAPRWLQRDCGRLLSSRLMREGGVHAVLLGVFDALAGGEEVGSGCHGDWKRVQAVAQVISHCPSQASSLSHYYSTIGPQLLRLLALPGRATVQVAAATISLMMKHQPALTRSHLIHPLTRPLRLVAAGDFSEGESPTDLGRAVELTIGSLHRLCGCVEPSSPLVQELQPLLPVLFKVWQASSEAEKTPHNFRSVVDSVLGFLVNSLESADKIWFLRHLAGMPRVRSDGGVEWIPVSPEVSFECLSEEGGLCVGRVEGGEREMWSAERMEKEGRAILELVGTLLSRLTGPLFLECLTCAVAILCQDLGYQTQLSRVRTEMKAHSLLRNPQKKPSKLSASSALLDVEKETRELTRAELYRRSLALYLTAALSEEKTSDILEQVERRALLEVLGVALECHAHIVTRKSEKFSSLGLLVVQPDLEQVLGGPITLSISLGYLSAILTGANQMEREHKALLSGLVRPLEIIATGYPDPELASLAGDLRVCVSTLGAVWSREMKVWAGQGKGGGRGKERVLSVLQRETKKVESRLREERGGSGEVEEPKRKLVEEIQEPEPSHREEGREEPSRFQEALAEAEDLQIPVRGHGLSSLARLVEAGDRETLAHSARLLEIFKDGLCHCDSYVYLPAIGGLVGLASRQPSEVLAVLCEGYAMFSGSQRENKIDRDTGKLSGKCSERSSELKKVSVEVRLKLGEALVRVCRECGDLLPHYSDQLLAAILSNARDPHPLVRASALSSLAQVCQLLGHSFTKHHHEVLGCVTQLLLTDPAPQVQQSALLVLTLLLKGLSRQSVEVLGGSLRDVYRLLKQVEGERGRDALTREHARASLGQLDQIMREWTFPQPSLTKDITTL